MSGTSPPQQGAPRLPLGTLLRTRSRQWHGHVKTFEEYIQLVPEMHRRAQGPDNYDGIDDFPTTPEARLGYVQTLYEAMTDFSAVSEPHPEAHSRVGHQVKSVKNLSDLEFEMLAWELQGALESAHLGYKGYTGNLVDWSYQRFGSFGARHRLATAACRDPSKGIVHSLAKASFSQIFAADPEGTHRTRMKYRVKRVRGGHLATAALNVAATAGSSPEDPIELDSDSEDNVPAALKHEDPATARSVSENPIKEEDIGAAVFASLADEATADSMADDMEWSSVVAARRSAVFASLADKATPDSMADDMDWTPVVAARHSVPRTASFSSTANPMAEGRFSMPPGYARPAVRRYRPEMLTSVPTGNTSLATSRHTPAADSTAEIPAKVSKSSLGGLEALAFAASLHDNRRS
ncbi:hypothetical protein QBC39DRAFT_362549 [Podospora conica]|nr:hypothetical protein QBC39DRAFT_362549 [Schizothecium conicum]